MSIFSDVEIYWNDELYVIPSNRVMGAIAIIEEHFSIQELLENLKDQKIKFTRLSGCISDVLNYAGASVNPEQVYAAIYSGNDSGIGFAKIIHTLVMMTIPKDKLKSVTVQGDKTPGKRVRKPRQKL